MEPTPTTTRLPSNQPTMAVQGNMKACCWWLELAACAAVSHYRVVTDTQGGCPSPFPERQPQQLSSVLGKRLQNRFTTLVQHWIQLLLQKALFVCSLLLSSGSQHSMSWKRISDNFICGLMVGDLLNHTQDKLSSQGHDKQLFDASHPILCFAISIFGIEKTHRETGSPVDWLSLGFLLQGSCVDVYVYWKLNLFYMDW